MKMKMHNAKFMKQLREFWGGHFIALTSHIRREKNSQTKNLKLLSQESSPLKSKAKKKEKKKGNNKE
jgi:hypothetical protein